MHQFQFALAAMFLMGGLCACGEGDKSAPATDKSKSGATATSSEVKSEIKAVPAEKPTLMLFCGAGILPAARALVTGFELKEKDLSGVTMNVTPGGSNILLSQIAMTKKGDLFMPGEELYLQQAIEKDLADAATRATVAYFIPVIFVQKGNPKKIMTLTDLTREGLKIGLGEERSCAVGKVSADIFKKNKIDETKLSLNVVLRTATVNELGNQIALKTLDAVIVWDTTALQFTANGDAVSIPEEANVISTIPIAVIKNSAHADIAKRFIAFCVSSEGRKILTEQKYRVDLPGKTMEKTPIAPAPSAKTTSVSK